MFNPDTFAPVSSLAIRGLRVAYREQGDPNCELRSLDPGRPPDQQSKHFYYSWGPDHIKLTPWMEEEERVRRKFVRQEGAAVRPRSSKPGPKTRHDWADRGRSSPDRTHSIGETYAYSQRNSSVVRSQFGRRSRYPRTAKVVEEAARLNSLELRASSRIFPLSSFGDSLRRRYRAPSIGSELHAMSAREESADVLSLTEVLERLAALEATVAGIARNGRAGEPIPPAVYSIRELCAAHRISQDCSSNSSAKGSRPGRCALAPARWFRWKPPRNGDANARAMIRLR
jgi:hypothetical protein